MRYGARTLPQVALAAVLLGPVANAGTAKFHAFTNKTCKGSHDAVLHSRIEVHAQGFLSYRKEGDDKCVDVSRWEVLVVTGRRVDRIPFFDWPDSIYSSSHALEWSDNLGAWHGVPWPPRVGPYVEEGPKDDTLTGRCRRPVDLVDLPATTPGWVRDAIPEHHDVRTRKIPESRSMETTTRGFFAVSMSLAATAVVLQARYPLRFDGYVPGVVRDSAATAGACHLHDVLPSKYHRVRAAITSATNGRYHLLRYNCQHWATDMLAK